MSEEDTVHTTYTKNPLASFAPQPIGVTFEGQEKGEKIILLLRPHFITLVPSIIITIFLILAPVYIAPFLSLIGFDPFDFLNLTQSFLVTIIWYLFIFGFSLYRFLFWYFNIYLLTNERIIDFDFKGLLQKETAYAPLTKIQDVTPKMIGFFATFFHYGDVYIQTAATRPEFEFQKVARPNVVAQEILEEVRKEEAEPPGVVM